MIILDKKSSEISGTIKKIMQQKIKKIVSILGIFGVLLTHSPIFEQIKMQIKNYKIKIEQIGGKNLQKKI